MRINKSRLEKIAKSDLREAAFHEAGHFIVARHYRVSGDAMVFSTGKGSLSAKFYRGQYRILRKPDNLSPYKRAVIAWAGPVAERLADEDLDTWNEGLQELYYNLEMMVEESASDQRLIDGWPDTWRTFHRAATIIERCHDELNQIARMLMLNGQFPPVRGHSHTTHLWRPQVLSGRVPANRSEI